MLGGAILAHVNLFILDFSVAGQHAALSTRFKSMLRTFRAEFKVHAD